MTNTPIAFFVFNRPEKTLRVFTEIRRATPAKLMIVADGPRRGHIGEAANCRIVRDIVAKVDWPCEVLTNYSNVNLGCKLRMSSGLDWVFNTVDEAIILEDDCLPHPSFFRFCDELLEKYRDDDRVMMVSGFNPQLSSVSEQFSYYFSKYPHIWGWASWSRAWKYYDVDMKSWPELRDTDHYHSFCGSANEARFWRKCFDEVYQGKIDTWDAQVSFMFFCKNSLTVFPNVNLISNIGFGADATHTKINNGVEDIETQEFVFPVKHSTTIQRDIAKDNERRKREYVYKGFFRKTCELMVHLFHGSLQ